MVIAVLKVSHDCALIAGAIEGFEEEMVVSTPTRHVVSVERIIARSAVCVSAACTLLTVPYNEVVTTAAIHSQAAKKAFAPDSVIAAFTIESYAPVYGSRKEVVAVLTASDFLDAC